MFRKIQKFTNQFRVGFKITELVDGKEISLSLTNINFDDFCADVNCNNGVCIVDLENQNHHCKCSFGFIGVNCTDVDYCKTINKNNQTGDDICQAGGGSCSNKVNGFACDCLNDKIWDTINERFVYFKHLTIFFKNNFCLNKM